MARTELGTDQIRDDSILNADVSSSAAIDFSKLATLSSGNLIIGSSGGVPTSIAVTGDIGIDDSGIASITALSVVDGDINASAAIAFSKLASLTSAQLLVGSSGNVATSVAITGDIGITNAGLTSITGDVIVNADVNSSAAIAYSKLNLSNSILNADINSSAAIAVSKLSAGTNDFVLTTVAGVPTWAIPQDAIDGSGTTGKLAEWSDSDTLTDGPTAADVLLRSILTTEGDVYFRNASIVTRLARGADGQVLTATASTVSWADAASGGHVIEDEGTPLTARDNLDFVGDAVTVTDAAPDTKVTINSTTRAEEAYVVGDALDNYSGSTTVFDLVQTYTLGAGDLTVFVNGLLQLEGASNDYVETDTDTITFNSALIVADNVQVGIVQAGTAIITPTGAIERREEFSAAGGDETFTLTTGTYTLGGKNLRVHVNGAIQLLTTNYTEDSTTTFRFASGLTASDTVSASWIEGQSSVITATAATEVRQNFSAAGGAETFTLTGGAAFTPGGDNLKVYLDGVLLQITDDYTEVGTTQVSFSVAQAPTAGQKVALVAITETGRLGTPKNRREEAVATASQTLFSLPFSYTAGGEDLEVYNDGVLMKVGAANDYVETSPTSITFNTGRTLDSKVTFIAKGTIQNLETGLPRWQKFTVAGSAFSGGTTGPESVALATLPAGGILHGVKMKSSVAWTGGSLTAYTLEVGISGTTDKYASAFDMFQAVSDTTLQLTQTFATEDHGATTAVLLTANSTTDDTGNVSTGASVDVWLLISEAV